MGKIIIIGCLMIAFCGHGHCVLPPAPPINSPQQQIPALTSIVELTNIDMLRERYLTLEKALWLVIRSGADQTFALQRIHDTHITFFAELFNERGVFFTAFDADQMILFDSISHINVTVRALNDHYLHANIRDFNQRESVGFARLGINVTEYIDRVFNVTDKDGGDFFKYIKKKGDLQNCVHSIMQIKSTNQQLFEYYNDISAALLKAYAVVQISFMFLTNYGIRNCVMEGLTVREQFKKRTIDMQRRILELTSDANRDIWMCDADDLSEKGNSEAITRLLQGYVDNEVNLNPLNDCKLQCHDYTMAENHVCFNGTYCHDKEPRFKCNGKILNCGYVGSDLTICPSDDPYRRYKYLSYDRGHNFGSDVGSCTGIAERATSWTRWFVHCSNCFCYCDETGPKSDRYFSLRPVISNTAQNMVITGISLRKHNQMFVWKITEGQLINNGQINRTISAANSGSTTGIRWKTGHLFNINDYHVEKGIDYHQLSWENRTINLDTLVAPPGKVLTGIRFQVIHGRLALAIKAQKFDWNTGKLLESDSLDWINDYTPKREQIILEDVDVPTKALSKSVPDINGKKFIEFGPTSRLKDAAQTTVPFIDIQLVEPKYLLPLSGAGIYYKGQPNYGGYIAPKIITYDFSAHVKKAEELLLLK